MDCLFPLCCVVRVVYYVFVMFTRADTVERPWEKACWFSLTLKASLFSIICTFSRTLHRAGKTYICLKSVSRSSGGWTFRTGKTRACLYKVGYFFLRILAQMISRTTTASFSVNLFEVQALMLSVPVVFFFELSSFNNFFTCSILGTRGELSGKSSGLINDNAGTWSFHGLVKVSWSLSTTVYRSSGVGVVDFDVSLPAPLCKNQRERYFLNAWSSFLFWCHALWKLGR